MRSTTMFQSGIFDMNLMQSVGAKIEVNTIQRFSACCLKISVISLFKSRRSLRCILAIQGMIGRTSAGGVHAAERTNWVVWRYCDRRRYSGGSRCGCGMVESAQRGMLLPQKDENEHNGNQSGKCHSFAINNHFVSWC